MGTITHGTPEFDALSRMLAMATRDRAFRLTLKMFADRYHIFDDCPELNVLWVSMRSWMENYGAVANIPSVDFRDGCLRVASQIFPDTNIEWAGQWAEWVSTTDLSGMSREHLANKLRSMCVGYSMMEFRKKSVSEAYDDCVAAMKEVEAARQVGVLPEEVNPYTGGLEEIDKFLERQRRMPMGIPFIDNAFDGGQLPGEMMVAVMPSGAGKTTLSIQGIAACVERELHVGYFPMEQPLRGDLMRRFLVVSTNSMRSDWAVASMAEVAPDLQRRLEANCKRWATYFHLYEQWQRPEAKLTGVSQFFDVARMSRDAGMPFHLMIIDWWGVARNMMLATARIKDSTERREFIADQLKQMALFADELETRVWVFHQMSGKEAQKKGAGSIHAAQEDTNLVQFFDLGLTSSRIRKEDSSIEFLVDKARMGAGGKIEQHLDGQRCKFVEPLNGTYRATGEGMNRVDHDIKKLADDEEEYEPEEEENQGMLTPPSPPKKAQGELSAPLPPVKLY